MTTNGELRDDIERELQGAMAKIDTLYDRLLDAQKPTPVDTCPQTLSSRINNIQCGLPRDHGGHHVGRFGAGQISWFVTSKSFDPPAA